MVRFISCELRAPTTWWCGLGHKSPSPASPRLPPSATPNSPDRSEAHPTPTIGIVSGFEPQALPPASPFSTGHLADPDTSNETVQAATFPDGTVITSLHLLVAVWGDIGGKVGTTGPVERLADVEILAPLRGRDVLCVGKNYKAHAAYVGYGARLTGSEFHNSGFDSSDTKAQPDFPGECWRRRRPVVPTHGRP